MDFGWKDPEDNRVAQRPGTPCTVYGFVVERSMGMNTSFCGGGSRQSHVYLSASSEVEIVLLPEERRQTTSAFLLSVSGVNTTFHLFHGFQITII